MKIDTGATSYIYGSPRIQAISPADSGSKPSSFASILAKQTQRVGNAAATPSAAVEKYDFKNITPKKMVETMNHLIKTGQMSIHESTSLAGMIPSPLSKVDYDGKMPDTFNQPWNFFSKLQEGIEGALSRNDSDSAAFLQQTIDMLTRFQGQAAKVNIQA